MIKITIKGASRGYDAAEWCEQNLAKENWDIWLENAWGDYLFEFKRPQDATIFGLKWLEHT